MNKKEIMKMLKARIKNCYGDLIYFRRQRPKDKLHTEGFRSRLDELLLTYHTIEGISFVEACKDCGVEYECVDFNFDGRSKG